MTIHSQIKADYNQSLKAFVKYENRLIGQNMRRKLVDTCENVADWTITGGTLATDYRFAYKGKSCLKATAGIGATVVLSRTFDAAFSVIDYAQTINNFADVHDSGMFSTVASLFLSLYADKSVGSIKMRIYNGTKYAEWTNAEVIDDTANKRLKAWNKIGKRLSSPQFTPSAGFDMSVDIFSIDKIEIYLTNTSGAVANYYVQEITTANAYVTENETSDIYVSKIFGDDSNNGQTKALPVRTVTQALTLVTSTRYRIIILDSETYKDNIYISKAFLTELRGAFLEFPEVSAKQGVIDETKVGARKDYRRAYYRGTGTVYYVSQTIGDDGNAGTDPLAPKATLSSACSAATDGDCVEILDSRVYDEDIYLSTLNITVQAAPQTTPTWSNNANTYILAMTKVANIYGIILQGSSQVNHAGVIVSGAAGTTSRLIDCTFKDVIATGTNPVAYIQALASMNMIVENNLFDELIAPDSGTLTVQFIRTSNAGTKSISNNLVYMNNAVNSDTFVFFGYIGTGTSATMNIYGNSIRKRRQNAEFNLYAVDPTAAPYTGTYNLNIYFNDGGYVWENQCVTSSTTKVIGNKLRGMRSYADATCTTSLTVAANIIERESEYVGGTISNNGIYVAGSSTRSLLIVNNVIKNFTLSGIKTLNDITNYQIHNNIIVDCDTSGIDNASTIASTKQVYNNIIMNTPLGITSTTALVATRCLFYNCTANTGGSATLSVCVTTVDPQIYDVNNYMYFTDPRSICREYGVNKADIGLKNTSYGAIIDIDTKSYLYYLKITGSETFCGVNSGSSESKVFYNDIHSAREGFATSATFGSSLSGCKLNRLFDNGVAIRSLNSHRVENNLVYDNIVGAVLRNCEFYHNTVTNNADGFVEVYGQNDVKNSIIYGNTSLDYDANSVSDYCVIGTRSNVDSTGENDIDADPLFIDSEYHVANKYIGYDLNSPAFRTASDAADIGAQTDCLIYTEIQKETYTFRDNPFEITEYNVPLFLKETDVMSGDLLQDAPKFVTELNLMWNDRALIDADMKERLSEMYDDTWTLTLYFDGVTPRFFKVKKQNQFTIKQARYLNDELPFGNVSLLVRELANYDIDDYLINDYE